MGGTPMPRGGTSRLRSDLGIVGGVFMPNPSQEVPSRGWLIGLLLVALVVRLGWVLHLSASDAALAGLPDQVEYLDLGRNLLAGKGLQFVDPRFGEGGLVKAYRTPGYPAFVAACGGRVRIIRAAQAILDTSTVLAAALLAGRWLRPAFALLAGAGVAANPFLIYFCGLILSETLFIAMLAWGMVLLVRGRGVGGWLAGAAVLALSIHVRPSALGLPLTLGIASLFVRPDLVLPRRGWPVPAGATLLLITVLVLLPWAIRNRLAVGAWVWTTTNGGITLYDGFNPEADGSSNQAFTRTLPQLDGMNEVARSAYLSGKARDYAAAHRWRSVELALLKIGRTWSPIPLSDAFGSKPLYVAAAAGYAIPLFLLAFIGLWASGIGRAGLAFLLLPALYFTVVHALSVGSLRYRIPAEVPMAVAAAGAVAGWSERRAAVREAREAELDAA